MLFFFSSRRRHTRWPRDWSSDVCSSDLQGEVVPAARRAQPAVVEEPGGHHLQRRGGGAGRCSHPLGDVAHEIGRASCRERVEISEVAGDRQTKKKNKKRGTQGTCRNIVI